MTNKTTRYISDKDNISRKRFSMLFVAFLIFNCLGILFVWSVLTESLEVESSFINDNINITFSISISFFVIGTFIGGFLLKKIRFKIAMIFAASLMLFGFFIASFSIDILLFYFGYGVCIGISVGVGYNILINFGSKLFPDRAGLAVGLLLCGYGFGSLIFSVIVSNLIISIGWRSLFRVLGILFFLIISIGACLLRYPSDNQFFEESTKHNKYSDLPKNFTTIQMVKQPNYWFYYLWAVLIGSGGLQIIGNAAPIALSFGNTVQHAALITGLLSITNGGGRLLIGLIYDKWGLRSIILINTFSFLFGAIILFSAFNFSNSILLIISFLLIGLPFGGVSIANTVFLQKNYGIKHFPMSLSVTTSTLMVSSFVGPPIVNFILDKTGSYHDIIYVLLIMSLFIIFFSYMINKTTKAIRTIKE